MRVPLFFNFGRFWFESCGNIAISPHSHTFACAYFVRFDMLLSRPMRGHTNNTFRLFRQFRLVLSTPTRGHTITVCQNYREKPILQCAVRSYVHAGKKYLCREVCLDRYRTYGWHHLWHVRGYAAKIPELTSVRSRSHDRLAQLRTLCSESFCLYRYVGCCLRGRRRRFEERREKCTKPEQMAACLR
jgi:hypothetical protein